MLRQNLRLTAAIHEFPEKTTLPCSGYRIVAAVRVGRMRSDNQYSGGEFSGVAIVRNNRRSGGGDGAADFDRASRRALSVAAAASLFEPRRALRMYRLRDALS